jgi:hypothetical protein
MDDLPSADIINEKTHLELNRSIRKKNTVDPAQVSLTPDHQGSYDIVNLELSKNSKENTKGDASVS